VYSFEMAFQSGVRFTCVHAGAHAGPGTDVLRCVGLLSLGAGLHGRGAWGTDSRRFRQDAEPCLRYADVTDAYMYLLFLSVAS
jgi:hypothetical protein